MKEKILSALKTAILVNGKTSVSDKTLNTYVDAISTQITDESQIAEAIKPHVNVLKDIQANINSVSAEAVRGKEAELNTVIEGLKKANPSQSKEEPKEEIPAWAQAIIDSNKSISEKLQSLEADKMHQSLSSKLSESLKTKNIPEFYSRPALLGRVFKDESEINAFAENLEAEWTIAKQELANSGFKETTPPSSGDADIKESDAIVAQINAGTKLIVEQQNKI